MSSRSNLAWPEFLPLPGLSNPHLQTIMGAFLPGRTCPPPRRRHLVRLSDGDAVVLHENAPSRWRPADPVAMLVHGLTGCHSSSHIRRLAARLLARNVRVFRIDLRGAGDSLRFCRHTYHAGRSDDLRQALGFLHHLCPGSPLWLLGVSMGGNISLKLAGEAAAHPVPGLARVAALNPPIDLRRCSDLISEPRNRFYERRFVGNLVRDARIRHRHFGGLDERLFPRGLSLRGFDDVYTAPRNGFSGALEYYGRSSSYPHIERIELPCLLLTARDDPFIAVEPFEELRVGSNVLVRILERGGHVGLLGHDGAGGIRWAERLVSDWLSMRGKG